MKNHLAVVTVELPRPVKGSELIGGVKALTGEGFIHQQCFDNGEAFVVGQYSQYPFDQILVTSSRESAGIRPDETYDTVEVMDTIWPGSALCISYENEEVVRAVLKFAEKLKEHFSDSVDTPAPSTWPQEVAVCAICEKIVIGGSYCSTDGENPPTKLVKVMLVAK